MLVMLLNSVIDGVKTSILRKGKLWRIYPQIMSSMIKSGILRNWIGQYRLANSAGV